MKYLVIAGVAVAVLLLMRQQAKKENPYDPANWEYIPDYRPGSGLIT